MELPVQQGPIPIGEHMMADSDVLRAICYESAGTRYWVMEAPKDYRGSQRYFRTPAIEVFAALFKICERTIQKSPEQKAFAVPATIAEVPAESVTVAGR
jgi:hypothetical protein